MTRFPSQSRLARGALLGTGVGLALLLLGAVRSAIRVFAGQAPRTPSVRELLLLPLVIVGCAIGGLAVSALTALRASRGGAALAGLIAAVPVAIGTGLVLQLAGVASGRALILGALTWAVVFGPLAGMTWLRVEPSDDPIASATPRLRTVSPPKHRAPEA